MPSTSRTTRPAQGKQEQEIHSLPRRGSPGPAGVGVVMEVDLRDGGGNVEPVGAVAGEHVAKSWHAHAPMSYHNHANGREIMPENDGLVEGQMKSDSTDLAVRSES